MAARNANILVSDQGGWPADAHKQILFQPFKKSESNGFGLGLSISTELMKKLGGSLSAEWGIKETSFVISLPLSRQDHSNRGIDDRRNGQQAAE